MSRTGTRSSGSRQTGGGSVVNTSSVGGFHSGPKLGPYPASTRGVIGLTVQAAADHGKDGIGINGWLGAAPARR